MNPKLRALIWEELRTGGVIAAWCTFVGGLCLLVVRLFDDSGGDWNYLSPVALTLNLLPPLLTGLLLLYRTGNSGILTGGFSGRILLLPVETWKLSGLALVLRAVLLAAATAVALALCRGMFWGHGPAWVLVLLAPACYLWLQSLEWLRRPVPVLAVLGFVPIFATIGFTLTQSATGRLAIDEPFLPLTAGLMLLIAAGITSFALAHFAVRRTRRGRRVRVNLRLGLPEAVSVPGWRADRGFRSPRWALLWHFLCRDGFVLPVFMLFFGAIALLGYGVWLHFADRNTLSWMVVLDWGVWPVFALSAMLWGGLRGGAGIQRGIRPVLTEYLYPVSAAEMAVTRLWGYGIVLGFGWAIAFTLSNVGFFLGDQGLAWRIWMGSLSAGESSLRELIGSRLFLPLVILIGAWVLTVIRSRLVAWTLGLSMLYATTVAFTMSWTQDGDARWILLFPALLTVAGTIALIAWTIRGCTKSPGTAACWLLPYALAIYQGANFELGKDLTWLPAAFVVVVTLSALAWSWQRGIIPLLHLAGCAITWVAMMLFAFPFGGWSLSGIDRHSLFFVTMLGALVVLPYPALLLDLHRRRHHDDTPVATDDHAHPRGWGLSPALRSTAHILLVLAVLVAAWLRWPAKPVYIETLRAEGKPATVSDLANYYGPLPADQNAAPHYVKAIQEKQRTYGEWYSWFTDQRNYPVGEDQEPRYGMESQVLEGAMRLRPNQPVWSQNWETALKYHEKVSGAASESLAKVAALNLPRSHYPIDIGSGAYVNLSHLSSLRDLARAQSFEIWMAAMEDRPEDALKGIQVLGPFAESLREEPILMSQLTRISIYGMMIGAVEQALNRTEFSEAQLAELQHFLSTVLPLIEKHSMIAQGMLGEWVSSGASLVDDVTVAHGINRATMLSQQWYFTFSRTVILRGFAEMEKNQTNHPTPLLREIENATNPQFVLPKIVLPGLDRARESEFRCRVSLDMAATACAVERYRLANGTLPTTLDALVPAFLEKVPTDPFRDDSGPVTYRVEEDGGYALYSWAQNRKDDGGIHRDPEKKEGSDWGNGDWIFSVAPLSFRNGPQLTDTPPMEDKDAGITQPQISRRRNASN